MIKRRNLSGIFIFDTLEGDDKRQPTCFEECREETQEEWLDSLNEEALRNLAIQLGITLKDLGTQLDLSREDEE